ncbi:hypothetical protein ACFL3Y_02055 [Pseudomonadota bacterium]
MIHLTNRSRGLRLHLLSFPIFLVSCATIEDMPTSADQVDFSIPDGVLDDESWAAFGYQVTYDFPQETAVDFDLALRAAQAGLIYAGMYVIKIDIERRTVIGHRGPSFDLNHTIEYAGVYVTDHNGIMTAKIYVSGETSGRWGTEKIGHIQANIRKGMNIFVNTEFETQRHKN